MLQDRLRKKTKRPNGGNGSEAETVDMTDEVPEVDDVLDEIDKALNKAKNLERKLKHREQPQSRGCGCGW